ncbi:hypothetical protein P3X46_008769 [Hevea brasiliensis]|uniref:Uncharacterized protein n=1 Tax=Hevea brasiliensis TaxID=3981 RepID=A0ABQ9MJQ7_HEVBR|nr:hypothetical protein P3X46_008769 [Hevea brasiliensis]
MANNNASEQPSASLALTPNNHPQKDELLVSGDRNFAIHGEIMLLVLLLLFAFFLLFLAYLLFKRRSKYDSPKLSQSELVYPMNTPATMFKIQFKDGTNLMPVTKLPL